nr:MAG TPA: Protein of unknown function (DUF1294) [Caudoviricetes sp.]
MATPLSFVSSFLGGWPFLKKLIGLFHHNKQKIFAVQLFPYLQSV